LKSEVGLPLTACEIVTESNVSMGTGEPGGKYSAPFSFLSQIVPAGFKPPTFPWP